MEKVGNFIGRTIFGVISVAVTAIVSVLAQRYMETLTGTPIPLLQSVPASAPANSNQAETMPTVEPTAVEPALGAIESQPSEPTGSKSTDSESTDFEPIGADVPNPLQAETPIDPVPVPSTSTESSDAPVQVLFEEEQDTGNNRSNDSSIMQTFWDKLKNK